MTQLLFFFLGIVFTLVSLSIFVAFVGGRFNKIKDIKPDYKDIEWTLESQERMHGIRLRQLETEDRINQKNKFRPIFERIEEKQKRMDELLNQQKDNFFLRRTPLYDKEKIEESVKAGVNPRCGYPLSRCDEGLAHIHMD